MERNLVKASGVAPVDLTDKEYYAVGSDYNLTAATGDVVYGIIYEGDSSGATVSVVTAGECYAIVGGTVAQDDPLTGGASGKLVKGTVGTHHISAIAMEAGSADDVITVKMI